MHTPEQQSLPESRGPPLKEQAVPLPMHADASVVPASEPPGEGPVPFLEHAATSQANESARKTFADDDDATRDVLDRSEARRMGSEARPVSRRHQPSS